MRQIHRFHNSSARGEAPPRRDRHAVWRTAARHSFGTVVTVLVLLQIPCVSGQEPVAPLDISDIGLPEELPWPEASLDRLRVPSAPPLVPCVVIDPGHGYRDYGAVGVAGTREKDVVLKIAQEIKRRADEEGVIEVKLTRVGDDTVSLVQRANIANRAGGAGPADAFVSIHVATWFDPTVTGFQVYYPGGGAGDFDIESVLEFSKGRQNTTEMIKRRWNRQYKRHVRASEQLALRIDGRMDAALIKRRGDARHAPLRLLRAVDMPSCLIEVGVISNSGEEARLEGKLFRERCAEAIYTGLLDFFKQMRPTRADATPAGSR